MRLLKLLLVMLVCAAGPAVAGPLEDAVGAYLTGDYPTALRLLRPIAEQGDASARHNFGFMYTSEYVGYSGHSISTALETLKWEQERDGQ